MIDINEEDTNQQKNSLIFVMNLEQKSNGYCCHAYTRLCTPGPPDIKRHPGLRRRPCTYRVSSN